jgi:hypothetical protein
MRLIGIIGCLGLLAITACGGDSEDGEAGAGAVTELTIVGGPASAPDAFRATISCTGDAAESTGAISADAAAAACAAALGERGRTILTTERPADQVCTEIYGSDHEATVTGSLDGLPVDQRLARTNGCFIDEWTTLAAMLPPTA